VFKHYTSKHSNINVLTVVYNIRCTVPGFAANATEICANCEYNNGVGYVGSEDNCHVFFQVS
jgi:hypothetical protein